jgi:polygalacturonase
MQQTNRPHGWAFHGINGGIIKDIKLWKPIEHSFSTSGTSNVRVFNNKILAVSDTTSFPFNTSVALAEQLCLRDADYMYSDGFSAGGTNLTFENNHVENGDDCLTVGSGASNIVFRNSYCEGGHGLSIGSLGKGGSVASVNNVLIQNVIVNNSLYAARFKSWTGGNGLAKNITWENISFNDVMFPVNVSLFMSSPRLLIACRFSSPKTTGTRILARARTLPC